MKLSARRTPNEVCIEYAIAAKTVRDLTALIVPFNCTKVPKDSYTEPCIVRLFNVKREDSHEEAYQEYIAEIKDEMCEQCHISLKAVEDRKEARKRLAAAKRSVTAVGKRLQREPEKDWERIFHDHTGHVGKFLSEMYAIMIDPLEGGNMKVKEMCALLKKTALAQREKEAA